MESKRKIEIGITIGILAIAIALIGASNFYSITFGDTSGNGLIVSDAEEDISYLKSIVPIDNQIPDLTVAVIFKNEGEAPVDISGSWNLRRVDTNTLLDSGTDSFVVEDLSNYTNLIQPNTEYIGLVEISYTANEEQASRVFETIDEGSAGSTFQPGGGGDGGAPDEEKGPYADFSEYDPEGNITLTEDRITFYRMHRDYEGSVYKMFSNGYFGQTFTHKFQFMITSGDDSFEGAFMPWSICDEVSTYHDFRYGDDCDQNTPGDNHKGLSITVQPRDPLTTDGPRGFVNDWPLGTHEEFIIPDVDFYNKTIYATVTRDNGYLVVIFYRDAARTDILNYTSIETGLESYRMIQAFGGRGAKACAGSYNPWAYVSGYIENLDLGN